MECRTFTDPSNTAAYHEFRKIGQRIREWPLWYVEIC
jgi:hypothetical protein